MRPRPPHPEHARLRRALRTGLVATLAAAGLAGALPGAAAADVVDDWNGIAVAVATAPAPDGGGLGPPLAMPHLATVSIAMYDTAMAFGGRYEPFHARVTAPPGASFTAAMATAGHDAMVARMAAFAPVLDARYAASLATVPDGPGKDQGIAVGRAVAADIVALRAGDGYGVDRPEYYVAPPVAAGVWTPLAGRGVFPWIGHLVPFTLDVPDQFMPGPPPSLQSRRWARDYNEIKAMGGVVSERTPEQTSLAIFFTDNATKMWNRLATDLADRRDLGPRARARLYAQLNTAGADALIGCWATKYHYLFWRPEAAITTTLDDGNPATTTDPSWRLLRPTPNFPEYTSGHSCITTASMTVLRHAFGTDRMTFEVTSAPPGESAATGLTQPTLVFHRFSDVVAAMGDARVFGGYHYRFAVEAGSEIGARTARWVLRNAFRATGTVWPQCDWWCSASLGRR
jgi:hypothetical protein